MDFTYASHRRTVKGIAGLSIKTGLPVVVTSEVTILENRVDGQVRSVTVLSDSTPTAKAVHRIDGATARY